MTTVTNTLLNGVSAPLVGIRTEIVLLAPGTTDNAFDEDSAQVVSRVQTLTDGSGTWTLDLIPNSQITPANTYYKVTHHILGVGADQFSTFIVPDNDDTNTLESILAVEPDALPVAASLVAFTPEDGMSSTDVQDAIVEAYEHGGGGGTEITFAKVENGELPWGDGGGFYDPNSDVPVDGAWYSFGFQNGGPDFTLGDQEDWSYYEMGYSYYDDQHHVEGYDDLWVMPNQGQDGSSSEYAAEVISLVGSRSTGQPNANIPFGSIDGGFANFSETLWDTATGSSFNAGAGVLVTDKSSTLYLRRRAGQSVAQLIEVQDEDGAALYTLNVDGSITISNGVTLFSYAGNPNSNVTANGTGDFCYDIATPAIWQATAGGDSSWVSAGGGGAAANYTFTDLTGQSVVSQGSGSVTIASGSVSAVVTPSTNNSYVTATGEISIGFGDPTAGQAGQPIFVHLAEILQLLGGLSGFNPYSGNVANFSGSIQGIQAFGFLLNGEGAVLTSFGGNSITDPLQDGDSLTINFSLLLTSI